MKHVMTEPKHSHWTEVPLPPSPEPTSPLSEPDGVYEVRVDLPPIVWGPSRVGYLCGPCANCDEQHVGILDDRECPGVKR
jgi:hypothetical protein